MAHALSKSRRPMHARLVFVEEDMEGGLLAGGMLLLGETRSSVLGWTAVGVGWPGPCTTPGMTRPLCLLALTLLLPPLAACHGRDARPTAAPAETPLPDVFGPLDWSTDAARLRARFPEARVVEGPGAERSHALDARGWDLPSLTPRLAIGLDPRFHRARMVRLIASRNPAYPCPY